MFSVIFRRMKNWKFRKQQLFMYAVTLGVLIFLSVMIMIGTILRSINQRAETILNSDADRISSHFDNLIDTTNQLSKVIMFDENIQDMLSDGSDASRIKGSQSLRTIIGAAEVDSIYIYDLNGHEYSMEDNILSRSASSNLENASWYLDVLNNQGGYGLYKDSDGFLTGRRADDGYLSVVRVINDLNTQKPIGFLIMNLSAESVEESYSTVINTYNTAVEFADQDGNIIYEENTDGITEAVYWSTSRTLTNGWVMTVYLKKMSILDDYYGILTTFIVIFLLAMVTILIVSDQLSGLVRLPVKNVLTSMMKVSEEVYEPVEIQVTNEEMTALQQGYNMMVKETNDLLNKIVEEQTEKRKYELDVLQAQIRPHFLYNTFDAVSALALMERNEDVFIMMQALGKYYRNCLHKGAEIIPLNDELKIIENYMVIMGYRFENVFTVSYDIDEEVRDIPILKLIMQPFVENAIFHGLRNRMKDGKIIISAKDDGNDVVIIIEDNGIGMSEEECRGMMQGTLTKDGSGFGVHSTVERLRLYYNREDVYRVESQPGKGTRVTIRISKRREA